MDIIPPRIIPSTTRLAPPMPFKKLVSPSLIIPMYGLMNVVTTAPSKIPSTGYKSTGLIPSRDLGSLENAFFSPRTRYPPANPANSAPKNPALTAPPSGQANVIPIFATVPDTNPTASPGRSAMLMAIYPESTGSIMPKACSPMVFKYAASGVFFPKLDGSIE